MVHRGVPHGTVEVGKRVARSISMLPEPDKGGLDDVLGVGVAGNPLACHQHEAWPVFTEPGLAERHVSLHVFYIIMTPHGGLGIYRVLHFFPEMP